ncbi:MAG: cystathionine gamma-synthase [Bacillaceae bacterium G1]|nr:cystathionine gamma-synthase [Bacillota bacterium]OJF17827.1 MAG: cystathionine gamma-synthase [Bacillaceae bacterium G1]
MSEGVYRNIFQEMPAEAAWETRALHVQGMIDPATGAASTPIYQASTFHQPDVEHPPLYDYARSGNPTREALERAIAEMEGGDAGFAFASGMAAISSVFAIFSSGDHLIVPEDVYGGTYRVLTQVFPRFGIQVSFVDTTDLEQVAAAIRPETRGIYVETPSNPTLKITDLAGIVRLAREHGLVTMIDNTFMTPYFQRPLELGFDIVIHSATKFLGGHSDVLAGLVAVRGKDLARKIYQVQNGFGAVLGVHDAWLVLRGMKTLAVRMRQAQDNAMQLARWLASHPAVQRVYYPGLADHPGRDIHERQSTGYGAVLSFDVGSRERALQVMRRVRIPLVAVSLGAVESILSYPAAMSHAAMPREVRLARGIGDGLLRYSVGLERVDDLIADLAQALV